MAFPSSRGPVQRRFGDRINPSTIWGHHLLPVLGWCHRLYLYVFFETGIAEAYSIRDCAHRAPVVDGRHHAQRAPLCLRCHGTDHGAAHAALLRIQPVPRVPLVLVGHGRDADLDGLCLRINGYMLPWDQLAQYITVTSFEWLDWLPIFNGTLMRNFLYSDHVGDRFFTLLSFMHLGIPLVLLMIMWIHVQRVPKARTTPPRPIVVGMLLTFWCSLVAPVHSQGRVSNLAQAVTQVSWTGSTWPCFLITDLAHGPCVALVVGASVLLSLLFPGGRRSSATRRQAHAPGGGARCRRCERRIQGARGRNHSGCWPAPGPGPTLYECRNGGCGLCIAVSNRAASSTALPAQRPLPDARGPGQGTHAPCPRAIWSSTWKASPAPSTNRPKCTPPPWPRWNVWPRT